jgi:predicted nuclease with TOPRIM domain
MEEYLASLEQRDAREQANRSIIEQYTRIADRLASQLADVINPEAVPSPTTGTDPNTTDIQSLRSSLAAAQQARAALEAEVASFATLKQETATLAQAIQDQNKEIVTLQRKVKDRNEEIKEGKKLVEQVQDEMVSLNLQLNMAEQHSDKLKAENKELVARWMKKMGQEADQMNEQSKW